MPATNVAVASSDATTFYAYDLADRLIAEVDAAGQTRKEYIWLDDLPVAVVDQAGSASHRPQQ